MLVPFGAPSRGGQAINNPQGFLASGDEYNARYDKNIEQLSDKTKCIDDTLVWSDDLEISFYGHVSTSHYAPMQESYSARRNFNLVMKKRNS